MADRRRAALAAGVAVVVAGCSSSGGKEAEESANAISGDQANTPRIKVAMVTHDAPGDTFWDIIRKGAEAAAAKDNVDFQYSSDPDSGKQATLIQSAIDSKVDGIAVTLPDPPALLPAVKKAIDAGIPVVAFNAGITSYAESGALAYFGSDETVAGQTGGKRAAEDGYKHVLCVIQEQGQVQLEARCAASSPPSPAGSTTSSTSTAATCPRCSSTIAAKLKQDPSIDFVVTLGAPDRAERHGRHQGREQQGQGRHVRLQPADPAEDQVRASWTGRSTSSRSCRATRPSTRSGSTRTTATSSAGARPR